MERTAVKKVEKKYILIHVQTQFLDIPEILDDRDVLQDVHADTHTVLSSVLYSDAKYNRGKRSVTPL